MMNELLGLLLRTVFVYFFIFLMMHLMGKREVGKLSVFDLVVSFMIADISAISLEDLNRPLIKGLLPIFTIVILQILLSYISLKNEKVRHWIDGSPIVIINKGKIERKTMAKARYNLDDLMMQLREKNIADIRDVEFAILETSGKLSVFPKEKNHVQEDEDQGFRKKEKPFRMPIPLILDGKIQKKGLEQIGKDLQWLQQKIQKLGYHQRMEEIFYASIDSNGEFYIDAKEEK